MFENVDGRTDNVVTSILIAHPWAFNRLTDDRVISIQIAYPWAFGSGELKKLAHDYKSNKNILSVAFTLFEKLREKIIEPRHEISNNVVCVTSKA